MPDDEREEGERETTYSGEFGRRNRSTPGRSPSELGLDPEEMKGHDIVGDSPERLAGDPLLARGQGGGERQSPEETPGVETMGTGGLAQSGGRAGGARGRSGTSDQGAGASEGPTADRGGSD